MLSLSWCPLCHVPAFAHPFVAAVRFISPGILRRPKSSATGWKPGSAVAAQTADAASPVAPAAADGIGVHISTLAPPESPAAGSDSMERVMVLETVMNECHPLLTPDQSSPVSVMVSSSIPTASAAADSTGNDETQKWIKVRCN